MAGNQADSNTWENRSFCKLDLGAKEAQGLDVACMSSAHCKAESMAIACRCRRTNATANPSALMTQSMWNLIVTETSLDSHLENNEAEQEVRVEGKQGM
jgi:hypothetical protein